MYISQPTKTVITLFVLGLRNTVSNLRSLRAFSDVWLPSRFRFLHAHKNSYSLAHVLFHSISFSFYISLSLSLSVGLSTIRLAHNQKRAEYPRVIGVCVSFYGTYAMLRNACCHAMPCWLCCCVVCLFNVWLLCWIGLDDRKSASAKTARGEAMDRVIGPCLRSGVGRARGPCIIL